MKFKYIRVNIIKSIEDDINIYLSNKYVRKDNFKKILAGYEERRKCEAHEAYKTDADLKEAKLTL